MLNFILTHLLKICLDFLGSIIIYAPPYTPDGNPIEAGFGIWK